jgi:alginate O-acetyltransferase complex protein AlgI
MIDLSTKLILLALVSVPITWIIPKKWGLDAVSAWSLLIITLVAPISALWLLTGSILTPLVLRLADRTENRDFIAIMWSMVLLGAFIAARLTPGFIWLGGVYFTLRLLHIVGDWWTGALSPPSIRNHLRYQLFLPVLIAGPINRFERFERELTRRRWELEEFLSGAERCLVGLIMAYVGGWWLVGKLGRKVALLTTDYPLFLREWALSAIDWIQLYGVFAGLTSVSLGISLMCGLRLEENFNRPWASRNLIEFWQRWHITLSSWALDYVYRPVAALSRNAIAGVVAAMLAIGLWHAFSFYYVLWGLWQALGIIITRYLLSIRANIPNWLMPLGNILGPLGVLAWLSLAKPVIQFSRAAIL